MAGERIGFIGTGIMGKPMTLNLLRAGYSVTVHNRTKSRAQELLSEGAVWANSPAEVTKNSDVVITCVPDTPDVKQVLLGENGVIEAAREGLICVDMSTISPSATKEMGAELSAKGVTGVTLVDAPISGGEIGAIEGKLSIMMGGPKDAFEKVRPIMEVMGKAVTHCGPLGSGQMTKLANQVMVIHTIMSIAEGLTFAEKAGLDLQTTGTSLRLVLRRATRLGHWGRR
jgi:3-hydroxyisobutyrate dehydrogenase-like beta-hydroxyacid dehydrogenase